MAELYNLTPNSGASRNRKRVGRGTGSGLGKTSGRGQKGQKSRSGGRIRRDFEGGQMPLARRIPKRGFKNINRTEYQVVNVRDLERCDGDVNPNSLKRAGLIKSLRKPVKILAQGEVEKALSVTAHKFSAGAKTKIESAGGKVSLITLVTAESS